MENLTVELALGYALFLVYQRTMESENAISTPSDELIGGNQKQQPVHGYCFSNILMYIFTRVDCCTIYQLL